MNSWMLTVIVFWPLLASILALLPWGNLLGWEKDLVRLRRLDRGCGGVQRDGDHSAGIHSA